MPRWASGFIYDSLWGERRRRTIPCWVAACVAGGVGPPPTGLLTVPVDKARTVRVRSALRNPVVRSGQLGVCGFLE